MKPKHAAEKNHSCNRFCLEQIIPVLIFYPCERVCVSICESVFLNKMKDIHPLLQWLLKSIFMKPYICLLKQISKIYF